MSIEMSTEMSLAEALNKCKQMVGHFKAFAMVAEVLAKAAVAEQTFAEKTAQVEKLEDRLAVGRSEIAELTARIDEIRGQVPAAKSAAVAELEAVATKKREDMANLHAGFGAEVRRMEEELERRREEHLKALNEMADVEAQKRSDISALEAKIQELRAVAKTVLG